MSSMVETKLAPPGAGLPWPELLIARALFRWRRWRGTKDSFTAHFQNERERIRALLNDCDAERGARQILIPRLRGLEDSSRNWSVWMTLEHLRIVNESVARVIGGLIKDVTPGGKASTAAVKPAPGMTMAVMERYERSCDAVLAAVNAGGDLRTEKTYAHPWFGPLDAAGWHALAAGHLSIHRGQIEAILNLCKGR